MGISAYRLAARIVSPWNPKAQKMVQGQNRTIEYLKSKLDAEGGYVWIHTASLGEFEQGRPLIEIIREQHPDAKILLSFFSPSGYEVRKTYDKVNAVCYLPMDTPRRVKAFLDVVRPRMAIFVKYEFWGNYLEQLHSRGVPTYIISSIFRSSQIFFKPWGGTFRKMLRCFTQLYVQNDESRRLLHGIGIDNVTVCGDTRLDRVLQIKSQAREFPVIAQMVSGCDKVLVMDRGKLVMADTPRGVFRQRNRLAEISLDVPPITELMYRLRENGAEVSLDVLSLREGEQAIYDYLRGAGR